MTYSTPLFDDCRKWIKRAREHGKSWDFILFGGKKDDIGLKMFLEDNYWDDFASLEDWKNIVELEKANEQRNHDFIEDDAQAMIVGEGEDNEVFVPTDPNSSWQVYKKHLLEQGFKKDSVDTIENATIRILRRLSADTTESRPVKGMVIGNVQSGKTANMAALMAMAADWGWNMFIVLSGTIENLRQQTQKRLLNDLNRPGNLRWIGLEHLSRKPAYGQRAQDLHFESDAQNRDRYFTVCIKYKSRLEGLNDWLSADLNKRKQMKILLIDDEADQAGVNTKDMSSPEYNRTAINKAIINIVEGKDKRGKKVESSFKAMNYIGYTATPYANVLNESGQESLYPRNFIVSLKVPEEYFGPQQIFGIEGGEYDGLDIVRVIDNKDLQELRELHNGETTQIPESLKDGICWFFCCVSTMRLWGYKKPISMLVHTSQKTEHHKNVANALRDWIRNIGIDQLLNRCEQTWFRETQELSLERFKEQLPEFEKCGSAIHAYPEFEDIRGGISLLKNNDISNIPLDSDKELVYGKGIHLCIDNCKNNGINEDGMYVRLAYPDSDKMPSPAPAFIVVGGATLSRGLTIEGLISTYFLRSVTQADTLMQMGRWFGYRKGYELLPRIWLTEKTNAQFSFLSSLDQDLRNQIHDMDIMNQRPEHYSLCLKNTPGVSFIRITAKKKMQGAIDAVMDFSGSTPSTYLFDADPSIISKNLELVKSFIHSLGNPEPHKEINRHAKDDYIWRNVKYPKIKELLESYVFPQRLSVFNDMKNVIPWISDMQEKNNFTDWNVVLAGISGGKVMDDFDFGPVTKVVRTRKIGDKYPDNIINISILRNPRDIIADIDLDKIPAGKGFNIEGYNASNCLSKRNNAGLDRTPQLIIYFIDKDSDVNNKSAADRVKLNTATDMAGLVMTIPGSRAGRGFTSRIKIKLDESSIFDGEPDMEGISDEN